MKEFKTEVYAKAETLDQGLMEYTLVGWDVHQVGPIDSGEPEFATRWFAIYSRTTTEGMWEPPHRDPNDRQWAHVTPANEKITDLRGDLITPDQIAELSLDLRGLE